MAPLDAQGPEAEKSPGGILPKLIGADTVEPPEPTVGRGRQRAAGVSHRGLNLFYRHHSDGPWRLASVESESQGASGTITTACKHEATKEVGLVDGKSQVLRDEHTLVRQAYQ